MLKRGAVVVVSLYAASLAWRAVDPQPRAPRPTIEQGVDWVPRTNEDRLQVFARLAPHYDRYVALSEAGGITVHRRMLCSQARGRVLELGVGTGRTLPFYSAASSSSGTAQEGGVESVLAIDASEEMLAQARAKYDALLGGNTTDHESPSDKSASPASRSLHPSSALPPVSFAKMDVHRLTESLPPGSFDTVLDSFGLCSYEDPARALQQMALMVRSPATAAANGGSSASSSPSSSGRILLLEHGRSASYPMLNHYLAWKRQSHCRAWGCEIDRDMDALVRDSGLRVRRRIELQQGRVLLFVLSVPPGWKAADKRDGAEKPGAASVAAAEGRTPSVR